MKYAFSFVVGLLLAAGLHMQFFGARSPPRVQKLAGLEKLSGWMAGYYLRPEPRRLPEAIASMKLAGVFDSDPKPFMAMVGFFAGVIETDPNALQGVTAGLPQASANQQKFVALAIALSGRSDWRERVSDIRRDLTGDQSEIDKLLAITFPLHVLFQPLDSPENMDMQWGYFVATGKEEPVLRVIALLDGTQDRADFRRVGMGHAAKWTLAAYAENHVRVVRILRKQAAARPEPIAGILNEVVAAGEARDAKRIRADSEAALRAWKERHPGWPPTRGGLTL